jgi:signal transduction histidine kinase/ActR/RegA family two-component response regulator
MKGDKVPQGAPPDQAARSAQECAVRWLSAMATATSSLGTLLAELAEALGASAAGVARLPDGEPVAGAGPAPPFPWRERPDLLGGVSLSPTAVALRHGDGHWLCAAVDGDERASWLLWVQAPSAREWSATEAASLALAGQALARHLRRPDGAPRWARPLLLRRRQQRFEEAAAAARRIAHDFGNVLTGILGFSELALGQSPSRALASHLNEIHRAAQVGQRLTNTLRLFTRRQWPGQASVRLASVVEDETSRVRGRFPGSCLDVDLPPDLPPVAMDAEPLRHVLAQLLDNAAEAVLSHGGVRLSAATVVLTADQCLDLFGTAEAGPHVEIKVEDSGCGLSPEARRRLLVEPFFTTKTRHRGYGLGVAYGILAAHRGALAVEPAAVGTVARAYLPVAPAPLPAAVPRTAPAAGGERVLVVDDDPVILQLVRTTLERAGYRVETVTSARDAVRSFTQTAEPFGLVLSDVVMPQTNGYDLLCQLRTHDAGVNVLFMSGQALPSSVRPLLSASSADLLTKPFGTEGLLRAVRSALERGRRRRPAGAGTWLS